ncbi:TPA: hypothetical protein ACWWUK_003744 [Citrobacter youngae]
MKKILIILALSTPLIAHANQWDITCAGVKLDIINGKNGAYVKKGTDIYPIVGGINNEGYSTNIYAKYLNVKTENDNIVPVDANDSIILNVQGFDGQSTFRLIDGRGNHSCSLNIFKAGE